MIPSELRVSVGVSANHLLCIVVEYPHAYSHQQLGSTAISSRKIPGIFLIITTTPFSHSNYRMGEIEIPEIPSDNDKKGNEEKEKSKPLKTASIWTLFMRLSNNKERVCLIAGFLCWLLVVFDND